MQTLADKSVHLISAFQMADFAHVIGSLQPTGDGICLQVAEAFYSSLINVTSDADLNRAVAEALNSAVRQVAKRHATNSRFDLI